MDEIVHPKGKLYYTMGEVSEMFDVRPSLLRFWEEEFSDIRPRRNKKGNRLYRPEDVDTIRVVYHLLKEKKMKIEVAKKYIKEKGSEANREAEIVERLMAIRAILVEIKQDFTSDGEVIDQYEEEDVPVKGTPKKTTSKTAEPAAQSPASVGSAEVIIEEEITLSSIASEKLPFQEQMLFEIVADPAMEGNIDFMIETFIAKTYDPVTDDDNLAVDPFAAFGQSVLQSEPEKEKTVSRVIEQTLF